MDCHAYLIRDESGPHHIKCITRDVSDMVSRQKQRSIDKKFQGVLEMAGGVAHSLNQPLTILTNLLGELVGDRHADTIILPKLLKMQHQIQKMNDIAQKIGNIKKYVAMDYVAGVRIVDIDKASWARKSEGNT
jgi:hypothetical protein